MNLCSICGEPGFHGNLTACLSAVKLRAMQSDAERARLRDDLMAVYRVVFDAFVRHCPEDTYLASPTSLAHVIDVLERKLSSAKDEALEVACAAVDATEESLWTQRSSYDPREYESFEYVDPDDIKANIRALKTVQTPKEDDDVE